MQKSKIVHRKSLLNRSLDTWKRYYEVKHGIFGLATVVIFVFMALTAPIFFPQYPGYLARVGPSYAAPEWTSFTDPNAPPIRPLKNFIPDPYFETDAAWTFNTTDSLTGSYEYDTNDPAVGTRSIKLTLIDNNDTETYSTNVKAQTSFFYNHSSPTWVTVSFQLKSRFTGTISVNSIAPYLKLHMPPDNPLGAIGDYLSRVNIEPRYPDEWTKYNRNITYVAYYYIFQPNTEVNFECGLEFEESFNIDPAETGTAEFWFDDVKVTCFPPFYGLLGTTDKGQDVMAQLFWGTQVSLYVGLIATFIGVFVGLVVGLISGYFGGIIDEILMRIVDFFLIMPTLPILMVLAAIFNPSLEITTIIIAIFAWPGVSRVIRSQVLVEKEKSYVEAARAAGAGDVYLVFKHVFPNVLTIVFVQLATGVSNSILNEAALSFLGLTPQELVSWGRMLQAGYSTGALGNGAWWFIIPPGVAIVLLSVGFVFIGYAVDKAMNPKQRRL
ncbi:MAG: ABC transporter permease [Candidatus Hodarchaeota archaeon]